MFGLGSRRNRKKNREIADIQKEWADIEAEWSKIEEVKTKLENEKAELSEEWTRLKDAREILNSEEDYVNDMLASMCEMEDDGNRHIRKLLLTEEEKQERERIQKTLRVIEGYKDKKE
jgi:predicted nuclease with TOPRIM domain